jgi:CDP-glycerol glycerophosphotransferase
MSSNSPTLLTRWFRTRLSRLLKIEEIESRLASLEKFGSAAPQKNTSCTDANLDPSVTKNILASLQRLTEGIVTLDRRLGSYRSELFVTHVSKIYPKSKTVVFAGGSYFGDNVKYAYLSFLEKACKDGIACYFLPYSAAQYEQLKACGLPCLPHALPDYSPNDVSICLGAKALVLDNHFVPLNWRNHLPHSLLKGAKIVQLWHGVPLKEIGLETVANAKIDDPNVAEVIASCGPFDVFVASSAASRAEWMRKFSFHAFSSTGYPRNDVLLRDTSASDKINVDVKALAIVGASEKGRQPVVFYVPTFRDYGGSAWFKEAEISILADYCATKGYLFYVNLHPAEQDSVEQFRQHYPKINFVAPYTDIYPLIKHANVLITDYSSLAFDFLLLDRPVAFYRPDHAEYVTRSRHLIEDHDQYLCGAVSFNIHELIKAVEEAVGAVANINIDPYRRARQALRQKLFDHHDALASDRLCGVLLNLLESTP